MLVISRRPGESVLVDGPAKIKVVRVTPDSVRLGIEADQQTGIWREELVTENGTPPSKAKRNRPGPGHLAGGIACGLVLLATYTAAIAELVIGWWF